MKAPQPSLVPKGSVPLDRARLVSLFTDELPAAFPGWEPRPGQLDMAMAVADALDGGGVVALEAGTGTGKSLAYLVPAALWAVGNDSKVVISTYTRTLQTQLLQDDLPVLSKVFPHRHAVLKGRTNYLCRRKLGIAFDESMSDKSEDGGGRIADVAGWSETTQTGDFSELGFDIDEELRDAVESDTDQTLRQRCPHYNECFYYNARRAASGAHLVIVNHALLFRDLATRVAADGKGILPDFDRVVIDEAHHLEQAATSAGDCRLSAMSVARAAGSVLPRRRRPGALDRLAIRVPAVRGAAAQAAQAVVEVRDTAEIGFAGLSDHARVPTRVRAAPPDADFFATLVEDLETAAAALGAVDAALGEEEIPNEDMQPVLDLRRARVRLQEHAIAARTFLADDPERVRFLDPGKRGVAAVNAPLDIAAFVQKHLKEALTTTLLTSATLAVRDSAEPWLARVGLAGASFRQFPSPFAYAAQAVLALPRDLPTPDAPDFHDAIAEQIIAAVEASRGGAFVLCTSYAAVAELGGRVEARLGGRYAILRQGRGSRERILARFRDDHRSVLFGTDSFWEGVSVKGDNLRLVIIPRLPFRVPTEPVAEARHERIVAKGLDPFRTWSLPEAVLRLRQGFGRLVRTQTDRGAVMILDRRIHEMWYGRIFLASLPNARRIVGPSRAVIEQLTAFFSVLRAPP